MTASNPSARILVINGPNLNLLGTREPEIYGHDTLQSIQQRLEAQGLAHNMHVEMFQSNHEGAIVDRIHAARDAYQGLIINAGAYTHTSIAIRDALLLLTMPIVEVHLSNIYRRETFRHHSHIADIAVGQISGFGAFGYEMALSALHRLL